MTCIMNERWPLYPKSANALKKVGNDLRDAWRRWRIDRAVSGWRSIATNMGIPASQLEEMSGAFEHAAGYNSVLKP
jgi:hypothetical protein